MAMNGTDVLILIDVGGYPTVVGSQRDATLDESNDTIDMSSKDAREGSFEAGRYTSEISLDALYVPDDAAYGALKDAMRSGTLVTVVTQEAGVDQEQASAVVTSLSSEFPDQGEATVSISLQVSGAWAAAA